MMWIIGHKGMLGTDLRLCAELKGLHYVGTDQEVDVTNTEALEAFAFRKGIEWVVNCSGYTAVEKAEEEPALCNAVNINGAGNIARLCESMGARMVQISTDYVFDGAGKQPYKETDRVNPAGVYAKSKAAGEELVRKTCPYSYVVRTAWLYGKHGKNFVSNMLQAMKERDSVSVVCDQRGSPTWTRDLAEAVLAIIRSGKNAFGTFHYCGEGDASWYEFALAIHAEGRASGLLSRDCTVKPIPTAQYPSRVRRPAYSVLSKEKIERVYSIAVPPWRESLHTFIGSEAAS